LKLIRNVVSVICVPNIEKNEKEGGLDSHLHQIFNLCKAQGIEIIYGLTKSKLGLTAKGKNTNISVLGILKYLGNEKLK
jgi:hypothetical protein